jgi:hypothetical protein
MRVVHGVQDVARNTREAQAGRQTLRLLDGESPDQYRPLGRMRAPDLVDDRPFLGVAIGEHDVRVVDANHRTMGGNDDHVEGVELPDF